VDNNKINEAALTKQIKTLVLQGRYEEAEKALENVDIHHIRNNSILCLVGETYMGLERYEEAEKVLLRVNEKQPNTRRVLDLLTNLYIYKEEYSEAEYYYKEFIGVASKDLHRYILRYRLDKAKGERISVLIDTLEKLKEYEYIEEWAYELASLYNISGQTKKCIHECDEIALWFGHGEYVDKAIALKCKLTGEPLPEVTTVEQYDAEHPEEKASEDSPETADAGQESAGSQAAKTSGQQAAAMVTGQQAAAPEQQAETAKSVPQAAESGPQTEAVKPEQAPEPMRPLSGMERPFAGSIDLDMIEKALSEKKIRPIDVDSSENSSNSPAATRIFDAEQLRHMSETPDTTDGITAGKLQVEPEKISEGPAEPEKTSEAAAEPETVSEGPAEPEIIPGSPAEPEIITEGPEKPETISGKTAEPEESAEETEAVENADDTAAEAEDADAVDAEFEQVKETEEGPSPVSRFFGKIASIEFWSSRKDAVKDKIKGTIEDKLPDNMMNAGKGTAAPDEPADGEAAAADADGEEDIQSRMLFGDSEPETASQPETAAEDTASGNETPEEEAEDAAAPEKENVQMSEAELKAAAEREAVAKEQSMYFGNLFGRIREEAGIPNYSAAGEDFDDTEEIYLGRTEAVTNVAKVVSAADDTTADTDAEETAAAGSEPEAAVSDQMQSEEKTEPESSEDDEDDEIIDDLAEKNADFMAAFGDKLPEAENAGPAEEISEEADEDDDDDDEVISDSGEFTDAEGLFSEGSVKEAADSETEEPKAEEAKAEEPKAEEAKAEEAEIEESKVEEAKAEEPEIEEAKAEDQKSEDNDAGEQQNAETQEPAAESAAAADEDDEDEDDDELIEASAEDEENPEESSFISQLFGGSAAAAQTDEEAEDGDVFDEDEENVVGDEPDDEVMEDGRASDTVMSIFGAVAGVKSIKKQLTETITRLEDKTLDKMDLLAPYDINFVVTGEDMSVKSQIAIGIAKALNTYGICDKNKLVRARAEDLNARDFSSIFEKLSGGCLIIESAECLNEQATAVIAEYIQKEGQDVAIVMEGEEKPLLEMFGHNPVLRSKFLNIIHIGKYNENELVQLASGYAKKSGYDISAQSVPVLKKIIRDRMAAGRSVNYEDIMAIVDDAVASLEKRNMKNLFMTVLDNKYEEAAMFFLQPQDFAAAGRCD